MTESQARIGFKDGAGVEQSLIVQFLKTDPSVAAMVIERHAFQTSRGEVVVWANEIRFTDTDEQTLKEAIYAWTRALETLYRMLDGDEEA